MKMALTLQTHSLSCPIATTGMMLTPRARATTNNATSGVVLRTYQSKSRVAS